MTTSQPVFHEDTPANRRDLSFNNLKYPLWLHESVPDELKDRPNLHRRLGLVLQQMAAHGRTGVVKGCRGENVGWRRTPLGGNGGMQFYLWWAPPGSPPLVGSKNGNGIYVRAVRHHDDHNKLRIGDVQQDYYPLSQNDITGEDEGFVGLPWTDNQRRFVSDSSAVRILIGRPGSGKTSALWQAVESRNDDRVLYVSWSRDLVQTASEHFAAFAPKGVEVMGYDFVTLLGEICERDVPRLTYDQSRAAFAELLAKLHLGRDMLGVWFGREDSLYAEIRAIILGRAIPGEQGVKLSPSAGLLARLTDAEYRKTRSGRDGVGPQAADTFLKIVDLVERHALQELPSVFPELAAAAESIDRLRGGDAPKNLTNLDRIVVDEIQDLTQVEIAVLVELCLAVERHRGRAPWLLLAGDEGQTVQPSGFEWARLNDLLNTHLIPPQEFVLDESVRYPRRIARVIDNAQKLYVDLDRRKRPANQQRQPSDETLEAMLSYVEVPDVSEAVSLLDKLNDMPNLAVVTPESAVPEWVPEHLKGMVLTPATVKGLEYQSVCVLNPGLLLQRLKSEISERENSPELESYSRRTAIDRMRVALSRATELLAFIEVEFDDAASELSRKLLDDSARYNSEDLIEYLSSTDDLPEDRVQQLVDEARQIIDNAPRRAWERAVQAVQQLGSPDLVNGVADETVRTNVHINLLEVAARLLVDGTPDGVERNNVVRKGEETINLLDNAEFYNAFRNLGKWTLDKESPPFDLLNAAVTLNQDDHWIEKALPPVSQALGESLDRYSTSPDYASCYVGNVEGWLNLIRHAGDVEERARDLRRSSVKTLLKAKALEEAEQILQKVRPEDLQLTGLLREAQKRWEDAVSIFEKAGLHEDAGRVRVAGAKDYCDKGAVQLSRSEPDSAIQSFDSAIDLNPSNGSAYCNRGVANLHLGRRRSAVEDYNRAISLNSNNVSAYSYRGYHYLYTGEYDLAIEDYTKVVDLNPNDADAFHNRATAYVNKGEHSQAIEDYTTAIAINASNPNTYNGRAISYRAIGKYQQARQDLHKAQQLGLKTNSEASWYPSAV